MNQTNGVLLAWLWLFGPNIALLLGPIVVHIDSIYHPTYTRQGLVVNEEPLAKPLPENL